jgi:hypothetical protein
MRSIRKSITVRYGPRCKEYSPVSRGQKSTPLSDLRRQYLAFWGLAAQERQVDTVAVPARSCTLQMSLPQIAPVDSNVVSTPHTGDPSGAILTIDG